MKALSPKKEKEAVTFVAQASLSTPSLNELNNE